MDSPKSSPDESVELLRVDPASLEEGGATSAHGQKAPFPRVFVMVTLVTIVLAGVVFLALSH